MTLIICNGMPRSGSTAVYNVVREYLERLGTVEVLGFLDDKQLATQTAPLVKQAESARVFLLKTHYDLPEVLANHPQVFEIYSVRNLNKIAESAMRVWQMSATEAEALLGRHTAIALRKRAEGRAFMLRYEDFDTSQKLALLAQLSAFLQLPAAQTIAQAAIDAVERQTRQVMASRIAPLKQVWSTAARNLNNRLRLGRVLRLGLAEKTIQDLKQRLLLIDKKTMLHPSHLGTNARETPRFSITKPEQQAWQTAFNYD